MSYLLLCQAKTASKLLQNSLKAVFTGNTHIKINIFVIILPSSVAVADNGHDQPDQEEGTDKRHQQGKNSSDNGKHHIDDRKYHQQSQQFPIPLVQPKQTKRSVRGRTAIHERPPPIRTGSIPAAAFPAAILIAFLGLISAFPGPVGSILDGPGNQPGIPDLPDHFLLCPPLSDFLPNIAVIISYIFFHYPRRHIPGQSPAQCLKKLLFSHAILPYCSSGFLIFSSDTS